MEQTYTEFLPINRADMEARGWDQLDFVVVGGDAYVDHPSFGTAIISRLLEAEGYKVGVLAQPRYTDCEDFKRFAGVAQLAAALQQAGGCLPGINDHLQPGGQPHHSGWCRCREAAGPG